MGPADSRAVRAGVGGEGLGRAAGLPPVAQACSITQGRGPREARGTPRPVVSLMGTRLTPCLWAHPEPHTCGAWAERSFRSWAMIWLGAMFRVMTEAYKRVAFSPQVGQAQGAALLEIGRETSKVPWSGQSKS